MKQTFKICQPMKKLIGSDDFKSVAIFFIQVLIWATDRDVFSD